MKRAGVLLVLLLAASCGQASTAPEAGAPPTGSKCHSSEVGSGDDAGNFPGSGLAGVWLTAPGFDDVTMTLKEDGTFTWYNRSIPICDTGTWTADETTITFAFAEDDPFCAGETLTWGYQLEGDRLTSENVSDTCQGYVRSEADGETDWEFERQLTADPCKC